MIKPNDLGKFLIAEQCQKINIDDIVRQVNKEAKQQILQSNIEVMGLKLNLLTSNTRFDGKRYWFSCPICNNRVGVIYRDPVSLQIGCRKCLKIQYRKQRFKGMIEGS
jgi:hypothetical protein